ncbi:RNA polymerase II transcription factor related protein [Ophiocordyceps sinensis CO18]|uniref:RNA polymerase II transcription factor related protein n=1 Tax=Ophiocordyceps sinensis (strain Co18 / CGMCC 3.14243) TaxID=911162 RepID=T5APD4_OPHSC|nr:RNA polymerase II transcription factor related protein [Ophiocordyceps sinensis CO18]
MAVPAGRALFKKKDGILTLTSDLQTVTWTPNSGGPPTISLPVAGITNLQQTPDSSPKVMLKIFEKAIDGADPVTYLFHFNTSEARAEAKAVKDLLSRLLADLRGNDGSIPKPSAGTPLAAGASTPASSSVSASMAFASAVNSQPSSARARWFDDNQLKMDIELQQSLMKKDKSLHQTYMEAIAVKPESISGATFNTQFWSTRTNHLRAHAIEINQKKGAYNVLSTVKPRTVDGELKLNISVEQVQMLLSQHPLVKRIYNENVPKLSEADFWSRFFLSRLSRTLRGERVSDNERPDPLFDKYDVNENTQGAQSRIMAQSVPHIIDLKANEENQGGLRGGNAKDVEMRPRTRFPIVRTLNSLSEKIMANVAPSDGNVDDGQGPYDAYNELLLRDLRGDAQEHRIMLNVKEQNKFFSSKQDSAPSANARIFARQNPTDVLSKMRSRLGGPETEGADATALQAAIDFDDESDSDEEQQKSSHVGSRAAIKAAEKEVMSGVLQQRCQKYGHSTDATSPMGLPPHMVEKCALTHATSVEFLHQFWNAFFSGDADRAPELQYLAESLERSGTRIAAGADEAEQERGATSRAGDSRPL